MYYYTIYRLKPNVTKDDANQALAGRNPITDNLYEVCMSGYGAQFVFLHSLAEIIHDQPTAVIKDFSPQLMDITKLEFGKQVIWVIYTNAGWIPLNRRFNTAPMYMCKLSADYPINCIYSMYQLSSVLKYADCPCKENRMKAQELYSRVLSLEDISDLNNYKSAYTRVFRNWLSLDYASFVDAEYHLSESALSSIEADFMRHYEKEVFNYIECAALGNLDILQVALRPTQSQQSFDICWFIRLHKKWIVLTDPPINFYRIIDEFN